MSLKSFFFPQVLYKTSSSYNQDIQIVEIDGKVQLKVNGIQQTGPYDESIFRTAFREFNIHKLPVTSALLIGLGGGFVAKLIHKNFPEAPITCVDIDECMVHISSKYFGLSNSSEIAYKIMDAQEYVQKEHSQFDLVVVDLYVGDEIPEFVEDANFLKHLSQRVSPSGILLINYQSHVRYETRANKLLKELSQLFSVVNAKNIRRNRFIYAHH